MYALVTGASSGIGKAIAKELAKQKINVILAARRQPELEALKVELEADYGVSALVRPADLSTEADCRKLFEDCREYHPEIVVNNAGFGCVGLFADIRLEDELRMINVNVIGLHILTKLFSKTMENGVILNISSMAAFLPTPYLAAYAATKAYVYSLSQAINFEMKKTGKKVRVLTLCPGPVETEFGKVAGAKPGIKGMSAKRCAKIAVRGILNRQGRIIPGFAMGILWFLIRFIPLFLVLPAAFSLQKKKK
jgi:short-subunit dehydrogenase